MLIVIRKDVEMTNIDQFESVFRSADKAQFALEEIDFQRVLVVTDLEHERANEFVDYIKTFLKVLSGSEIEWTLLTQNDDDSVKHLLEAVQTTRPDLICTYRNLHGRVAEHPHSLGVHLDVLTQATSNRSWSSPVRTKSTSVRDPVQQTL